LRPSL